MGRLPVGNNPLPCSNLNKGEKDGRAAVRSTMVETSTVFDLLTSGNRTALPRQQTLRALIDWSYNLLSEKEKTFLRRLSVFMGGWTLDAAEAICGTPNTLELLTHLVDKSLESIAYFSRAKKQPEKAVRIFGWAATLRKNAKLPLPAPNQSNYQFNLSKLHEQLVSSKFEAAWAEGQSMSKEQVLTLAMEVLQ